MPKESELPRRRVPAFLRWLISGLLVIPLFVPVIAAAAAPPNILFIMSDDHAAHAIGSYGSRVNQTPNLDRIAAGGVRFNHCFVNNSICTPSRAAILTGKYSHLNGVTVFNRFDGSQPHVAKLLQKAGYQTAIIGKWHLFSDPTGFDYWNILPGQGRYHDPVMIELGKTNVVKGYVTDIITDLSIQFLKNRDTNKPFLLLCHHKAPHREWSPDAKHATLYDDVDLPEPATFNDDYQGRSRAATEATMRIDRDLKKTDVKQDPPPGLSGPALKHWKYERYIKDYLRCIASVDDNVGRLLDYLDQSGLSRNTMVIYTSDQGFFLGDHGWFDKRFMYEESLRMPLLVRFPGTTKAGTVNDAMVMNLDFAPTFLDLAGVPVPPDMQGRSLAPLLRGEQPKDWRTSMYYRYYHYPQDHRVQPHYGVRTERYKLIYFNRLDEWELYDLDKDRYEMHNVYADPAYAETVKNLKTELFRLKKEVKDEDQYADQLDNGNRFRPVPLELVLRYDFAQITNGIVTDISGKGHHGKVQQAESAPGRQGRALKLTGQSEVALSPLPASFDPANKPFTVGAWCKPEQGDGMLISAGGGGQGFALYLRGSLPHFGVRAGGELAVVQGKNKLPPGQWTHLTGVFKASGEITLLVDGKPAGSAPASPIGRKPREGLTLGADPGSRVGDYDGPLPFRGLIEDARVYWGQLDPDAQKNWSGQ